MNIFVDCEFNSMGGQLISMGLVSGDGKEHYFVIPIIEPVNPWVEDNVIPILGKEPIPVGTAQVFLQNYLMQFDSVHLIADWPDDIKYFCEFLISGAGERLMTPPLTMEIRRDIDSSKSDNLHNALADAWAIKESYESLQL